ncbi:amidase-like protein [Beauveria bassiana ARSEF 2860]|uniref:Amidase-like protein n=1 Tax=Beauveria bassiana (strain ARSEF 2860) TaxID=655819 RepID=J4UGE5_BEAB2|nr:amidase-like protein [Beauveria bassiana ARSEF 2860]EJP61907.1 amidase-like protein [Beauveria bassiana ARSEF 2860]
MQTPFKNDGPSSKLPRASVTARRLGRPFLPHLLVFLGLVWTFVMTFQLSDRPAKPSRSQPALISVLHPHGDAGDARFDRQGSLPSIYPLRIQVPAGLIPTTLITLADGVSELSLDDLEDIIRRFEGHDDVWDRHFLACVVVVYHGDNVASHSLAPELASRLKSLGTERVALAHESLLPADIIAEGPYFATPDGLLPVRKLFPDNYAAFVASLVQSPSQTIKYLAATTADGSPNRAVAVPSRLYHTPTPEKPLNGLRVAIKDNIDVAGVKTFASCLSYGHFYGAKAKSAPAVQRLLDLGAIVIGKTGLSQFADAEDPTGDFVDFHAPWNPRGDGNRSPGGSSFGSGAAAGAYDWIDFTIGTDSGGSVRQPAASQSVFGLRPSRGVLSVDGTVIIHRDLDAIGILSRDLGILETVSSHLYNIETVSGVAEKETFSETPMIIYPTHLFPVEDPAAQALYDKAVTALEKVLGVNRRHVNFREEWEKVHPGSDEVYEDYFQEVFYDHVVRGQFHERASFRDEYRAKFGRPPYVNPLSRFRWTVGSNMTEEHFSTVRSKREEFQRFIEAIFGNNAIMIPPFKFGEPESRDMYRPDPELRDKAEFGWGLRAAFQSPMAGQPEIVVPVGQLAVFSSTSQRDESYGVIASLIGSKGLDLSTLAIATQMLQELGVPRIVSTGRTPFNAV